MKTILSTSVSICLLFFSFQSFAQCQWGLKAGPSITDLEIINVPDYLNVNDDDFGYSQRFAYFGGVTFGYNFTKKFSVGTELLYELKGSELEGITPADNNKVNLHYLTVPVLLQYRFLGRIQAEIGAATSYRLAVDYQDDVPGGVFEPKDIWTKKWDIGLIGGLKFYPTRQFYTSFRYVHGLTDQNGWQYTDINGEPLDSDIKLQNRAFQFSLGYEFSKGK